MTKPWMGVTPPPPGQGYYPSEYFAPKPPATANRFDFTSVDFEPLIGSSAIEEAIRKHMESFYRSVEEGLEERVIKHFRDKGWTVEPPKSGPERPMAHWDDLERHTQKQDCSWSDAWNYFRDNGYDVDHLPYSLG